MIINIFSFFLFSLLFMVNTVLSYDILHLYRATPFVLKPRFDRESLFSFDFYLEAGAKRKSLNAMHDSVPLFDLFGTHNMKQLPVNVPGVSPDNNLDFIMLQLAALPNNGTFGTLSISGRLTITEANVFITQNAKEHGLFGQVHIPVRSITISLLEYTDLSPLTGPGPNRNTPEWKLFLQNFDQILQRYNISQKPIHRTFVGDISLIVGWTHSYQEMIRIDFVDVTFLAGLTLPTGPRESKKYFTALPIFDGGYLGFPLKARVSVGAYEWVTAGFYSEITWFLSRKEGKRIQTAPEQSGLIRLTTADVTARKGTQILLGGFIEADHWIRGFSSLIGYSYATRRKNSITARNEKVFPKNIINNDQLLRSWNMHTFHVAVEYDFSEEGKSFGPRIGLLGAVVISGKRIIKTNLFGGSFGLELLWDF